MCRPRPNHLFAALALVPFILATGMPAWGATSPASADAGHAGNADASLAIFAAARPPIEGLAWFDEAALVPALVTDAELAELRTRGVHTLAIVDRPASPVALAALLTRGFDGFLLDAREAGPAAFTPVLAEIDARFPQARRVWRGSGAAPAPAPKSPVRIDGVVVDGPRPLEELTALRKRLGVRVVVVERVGAAERDRARVRARQLADAGLVPYVMVGGRQLGVGRVEHLPRRILALYDSSEEPYPAVTFLGRFTSVPLEYWGYVLDFVDVRKGLPTGDLASRYAAIVSRYNDEEMPAPRAYQAWLEAQMQAGLRVVILGRMGFPATRSILDRMGLSETPGKPQGPIAIVKTSRGIGFEAHPTPLSRPLPSWRALGGDVMLELRDARGQTLTPIVTGPWGGMALDPYLMDVPVGTEKQRWILDPFVFLARALDLEPLPVPDTTTENGRRLLFIHIDGDAFASVAEMPGKRFAGEVISRDFLRRYPFPTTVSVIESDTSPTGNYPHIAGKLEAIARDIFALPNVEPASHSYSHPFDWTRAAQGAKGLATNKSDPVHMPIPGYTYSAAREIGGSLRYISERLAPASKPARVFLWSGDALPQADALREISAGQLFNMNGGSGEVPLDRPTLSMVNSLGRHEGGMLQIYSQAQNDNVYTNEWRGPYYGFRRVVDMFRYSESPRRLKPINIYYHFYSGTKQAALSALGEAYDYAAAQATLPLFVSEVCRRIAEYFQVDTARRLDGGFELRGFSALRTVRVDHRLGWPDLDASSGVIGVAEAPAGAHARYLALDGGGRATVVMRNDPPRGPYLAAANAPVVSWKRDAATVRLHLRGHLPVVATIGNCLASAGGNARARSDAAARTTTLSFPGRDTGEVVLRCR